MIQTTRTWSTWKPVAVVCGAVLALALTAAVAQQRQAGEVEQQLVTREQVKLNLDGAHLILREAIAQAERMDLKVNISIVDEGGHMLAFARMDGARPASAYSAMTKARAAATLRMATGPVVPLDAPEGLHVNLGFQNAADFSGGTVTTLPGGEPIEVNGQVIGAVGVGGAKSSEDVEIATAGIEALLEAIGE